MTLNIGDIVQLKSGGPKMTVNGIVGDDQHSLSKSIETALRMRGNADGSIYCSWFLVNKLTSGTFILETLKKIDE